MRVDKFLKVSRILKRRSVANAAADSERVFVNGRAVKPAYRLKIGESVRVELGKGTISFVVKSLNEKAGKDEAATLYEVINNSN
ncbi:MAG: S4 domain-containing protein [Firmicutes bacterium]|nr:S4 domain-containing protein [Bacillota bacterium]